MERKSPSERRLDAIGAITHKFVDQATGSVKTDDRQSISTEIRAIVHLGRTERWCVAIERWSDMVLDSDNPLQWAIIQGAICTGFAA